MVLLRSSHASTDQPVQARALIAHNLAQLSPEDQTIYRAKTDFLAESNVPSKNR
jgi:hypothetical protein